MCKSRDNRALIVKIIRETSAYKAGGIDFIIKRKSIIVFNPHDKDFKAITIFNSLGIFRITIKYDKSAKKVYLKVK